MTPVATPVAAPVETPAEIPADIPTEAPAVVATESAEPEEAAVVQEEKTLDIILTKKSTIETKLFSMLLDDLKFDYKTSKSFDMLIEDLKATNPRVILIDKELPDMNFALLKETVDGLANKTSIVMMVDPAAREETENNEIADEIINNLVNKDLLRLIVEKYTK